MTGYIMIFTIFFEFKFDYNYDRRDLAKKIVGNSINLMMMACLPTITRSPSRIARLLTLFHNVIAG